MVALEGGQDVGAGCVQFTQSRPPMPVVQSESGR